MALPFHHKGVKKCCWFLLTASQNVPLWLGAGHGNLALRSRACTSRYSFILPQRPLWYPSAPARTSQLKRPLQDHLYYNRQLEQRSANAPTIPPLYRAPPVSAAAAKNLPMFRRSKQTLVDKYGRDPAWKDPEADTKAPKKKKPSTAKQVSFMVRSVVCWMCREYHATVFLSILEFVRPRTKGTMPVG